MRTKPPRPLEREVQRSGIALLRGLGWTVHRRNVGAMKVGNRFVRFSEEGASDTYGVIPGIGHFELEFKRPGERPTKDQLLWLLKHNHSGSVGFWVDNTATLEAVARAIMAGYRVVYDGWTGHYDLSR